MKPFDFYAPTTVDEALELMHKYQDSVSVIAGGTDLVLELNEYKATPAVVIDLKKIKELNYIRVEDGVFRIGAMATHASLAADQAIKEKVRIRPGSLRDAERRRDAAQRPGHPHHEHQRLPGR